MSQAAYQAIEVVKVCMQQVYDTCCASLYTVLPQWAGFTVAQKTISIFPDFDIIAL